MRAISGDRSLRARINATEWREIQRVLAGGEGAPGVLGALAPFGLCADGELTSEALDLFRGFAERRGSVTARLRSRSGLVACQAWFSQSRAGTIMIDDGEALVFQQCAPGFFPVFLRGFLRIAPLPLAKSEGAVIEIETVTRLLEAKEDNGGLEGDDERLADSLREAAPEVSRAVVVGDSRKSSRGAPERGRRPRRACNAARISQRPSLREKREHRCRRAPALVHDLGGSYPDDCPGLLSVRRSAGLLIGSFPLQDAFVIKAAKF